MALAARGISMPRVLFSVVHGALWCYNVSG
jgi:hypothetical protein